MSTITVKEYLHISDQIHADLESLIVKSRPPKSGPDRLRVDLVLTIAEQFEATLLLAKAQMTTHSATHVRSMIEALVAMKMLEIEIDSGYVDRMQYEKLRGELRVYKGIFADPNMPENEKQQIKERYDICNSEIENFRAAGHKPKKISDDLGAAKLWYLVGPYSMMCAFSHNDLAVLAERHVGENGMIYKQEDSPVLVESVVSIALRVLMDATNQFGTIANFPDGHFDLRFKAMNQKWASIIEKRVVR